MTDVMRSNSITVRMTPRQAVAALRALEHAALTTEDRRCWAAHARVSAGLWDAGWLYDETGDKSWRLVPCRFLVRGEHEKPSDIRPCGRPRAEHPVTGRGRFENHRRWIPALLSPVEVER